MIRSVADVRTGQPLDCPAPRYFDRTWTFALNELGARATRLIVQERSDFRPSPMMTLIGTLAYGPADFRMSRKMLLGIKRRAEPAVMKAPGEVMA